MYNGRRRSLLHASVCSVVEGNQNSPGHVLIFHIAEQYRDITAI
jgi:hypothetical protein